MLDHGINVAFSTDAPVVKEVRPLTCIADAMDRKDMDGEVISPNEKIGLMEGLECYTVGGARANGVEGKVGSLEVGKMADLVLLGGDLPRPNAAQSTTIAAVWKVGNPATNGI